MVQQTVNRQDLAAYHPGTGGHRFRDVTGPSGRGDPTRTGELVPPVRSMARPREFDEEQALAGAILRSLTRRAYAMGMAAPVRTLIPFTVNLMEFFKPV